MCVNPNGEHMSLSHADITKRGAKRIIKTNLASVYISKNQATNNARITIYSKDGNYQWPTDHSTCLSYSDSFDFDPVDNLSLHYSIRAAAMAGIHFSDALETILKAVDEFYSNISNDEILIDCLCHSLETQYSKNQ